MALHVDLAACGRLPRASSCRALLRAQLELLDVIHSEGLHLGVPRRLEGQLGVDR
eukprot:CAMPEP_0195651288 /NCGR_PEP_ID=MMETSP0815-20121206/32181_1 /TAXON_ID=97485 /ORGANISM="Prymnesium parvum, Strain Texoma1" /LENGTH=54 /DNA_ID=CAMNT_0040795171 /DNA_START=14 /DNA_END=174 /DNA_ORIENTATION=-